MTTHAYVNVGSLQLFSESVSDKHKQDVLDSTLFAQKGADYKHNRIDDPGAWFLEFISVLFPLGWAGSNWHFMEYTLDSNSKKLSKAVYDVMSKIGSNSEILLLDSVLRFIDSNPDKKSVILFENQSHNFHGATFNISLINEDIDGLVSMKVGAFYFKTETNEIDHLFKSEVTPAVKLTYTTQTLTLNNQLYKEVRKTIKQKISGIVDNYIATLTLS